MNEALIEAWNSVVWDSDTVYFLGDFAFTKKREEAQAIFSRLRGDKILIKGNHDYSKIIPIGWQDVRHYEEFKLNKQRVVLFHYPIVDWNWKDHGSFHLYGHVHGRKVLPANVRALDVGVDAIGPVPLSFEQIEERLSKIDVVPGHSSNANSDTSTGT